MSKYGDMQPYDHQFITAIEKEIKKYGFEIYTEPLNQTQMDFTASLSNYKGNVSFVYQSYVLDGDGEAKVKFHYYAYDDISYGVFEDMDTGIFTPVFKGYNQTGKVIGSDIKKYLKHIEENSNDNKTSIQEATFTATTEIDDNNATDEEILRIAIASELSAINLYKSLARKAQSQVVIQTLLDIAREEQVHIGEFEALLEDIDMNEEELNYKGREEVEGMYPLDEKINRRK